MVKKEKKNKEKKDDKSFLHAPISWYPGHMAKTRREIIEDLKLIDVVIELLDSRIPISSRNPDIAEITKNKDRIIALNKSDLSDKKENEKWIKHFKENGLIAIECDSNNGRGINEVLRAIEKIKEKEMQEYASKGRTGRKIRAMILGIPNVGKSSFINRVSKTNRLEVGNKPGVTKKKQWIRINEKIELLDTPGVLWPKFDNEKVALNLAYTGSIKDEIFPQTEIAYQLLKYLLENYKGSISERYNLSTEYINKVLNQNQPENFNIYEIMQEIGKKRGAIVSGGQVDDEKVARIILDDFRSGKMGKITLERCYI